jgi:hypothetical protein
MAITILNMDDSGDELVKKYQIKTESDKEQINIIG